MHRSRDRERENKEYEGERQEDLDAVDLQTRIPEWLQTTDVENTVEDEEGIIIAGVRFQVREWKVIHALSDINSEELLQKLEKSGGLQEKRQYIFYTVDITNENQVPVELELNGLSPVMMRADGVLTDWYEIECIEGCVYNDSGVKLAAKETRSVSYIACQGLQAEDPESAWYLCLNFTGYDINKMSNQIFFLRVVYEEGEKKK